MRRSRSRRPAAPRPRSRAGAHAERLEARLYLDGQPLAAPSETYYFEQAGLQIPAVSGLLAGLQSSDGSPLTASLVSGPTAGSLTLNADGSFDYAPTGAYQGLVQFTYDVTDGSSVSNVATVSLVQNTGQVDLRFGPGGLGDTIYETSSTVERAAVAPDGGAVFTGGSDLGVVRVDAHGKLDYDFGPGGTAHVPPYMAGTATAVAVEPDGKVLAAGQAVDNLGQVSGVMVARYNTDGSLDTSFGTSGTFIIPHPGALPAAIAVDASGNIVVASMDSHQQLVVDRLTTAGALDATFGTAGESVPATSLAIGSQVVAQADGGILIGGSIATSGVEQMAVLRLDATGAIDPSFGTAGIATVATADPGLVRALALTADGSILVAGPSGPGVTPSDASLIVAQLSAGGVLDPSFATSGLQTLATGTNLNGWTSLAVQSNGKIVVAEESNPTGTASGLDVLRLAADGSLDPTWNGSGQNFYAGDSLHPVGVDIEPSGEVVVLGEWATSLPLNGMPFLLGFVGDGVGISPGWPFQVVWGAPDDTLDVSAQGYATDTTPDQLSYALVANSNPAVVTATLSGSLLHLSYSTTSAGRASVTVRVTESSGQYADDVIPVEVDPTAPQAVDDQYVYTPDASLVVDAAHGVLANDLPAGYSGREARAGAAGNGQVLMNPDGSFTYTPSAGFVGIDSFPYVVTDGDGSEATGTVTLVAGPGSLDMSYGSGGIATVAGSAGFGTTAMQTDNKLLVGGRTTAAVIERLDVDGNPDASFGNAGIVTFDPGVNGSVTALAVEGDGKIVAAGYTTTPTGGVAPFVSRWNADGTPDTSFGGTGIVEPSLGDSWGGPFSLALLADGRIVLGALTTIGTGPAQMGLVCFGADGSLDTSFADGGQLLVDGFQVLAETDGTLLVAALSGSPGAFNLVLTRLDADGSLDAGYGTGGVVTVPTGRFLPDAVRLTSGGQVVATSSVYGSGFPCAMRVNVDGTLDEEFGNGGFATADFSYTSPEPQVGPQSYPVLQADGKVLIAYPLRQGTDDVAMVRFNADGTLDRSFGSDGQYVASFYSGSDSLPVGIQVQTDGKVLLVAGSFFGRPLEIARYFGDGPIVDPLPAVRVQSYDAGTTLALSQSFAETVPGGQLTFSVISNSDPNLVQAQLGTSGQLALSYLSGKFGSGRITVRATDAYGQYVDSTFDVDVHDVWQNASSPFDVDRNGIVAPLDALVIINRLNQIGPGALSDPSGTPAFEYDTNGDGLLAPIDALLVINELNALTQSPGASDASAATVGPAAASASTAPSAAALSAVDLAYLMLGSDAGPSLQGTSSSSRSPRQS